jgi:Uma2 family endonuclease
MDTLVHDPVAELLALGEGKREWVRGSVLEMEPTSDEHDETRGYLDRVIGTYASENDAGAVKGEQFAERLREDLVRIPDIAFFRKDSRNRIKPTYSEGGADLVIEIVSPESRGRDRGDKFYDYEAAGVEEYWIVDPARRRAEFYRLRDGAYEPVLPDDEGRIHSSTLPGFFIRVEWLWNRPKLSEVYRELGLI